MGVYDGCVSNDEINISYHDGVMSLMPHILVGPGFPVVLGGANKQAKREEGLKKINFKRVPKFKYLREYLKIFFVGGGGVNLEGT